MSASVDDESLRELVDASSNHDGQVRIEGSYTSLMNSATRIVAHNGTTLQVFIEEHFDMDVLATTHSGLLDPIFANLGGGVSSAISIYDSHVDLLAS